MTLQTKPEHLLHDDFTHLFLSTTSTHDKTTFSLSPSIDFSSHQHGEYNLKLVKIHMFLTQKNVYDIGGFQTLNWFDTGVPQSTNFNNGNYSINDLDTRLTDDFIMMGLSSNFISFGVDFATGKTKIVLLTGARLDLSDPTNLWFAVLMGFNAIDLDNTAGPNPLIVYATNSPTFNNFYKSDGTKVEINNIYVNCDLLKNNVYSNLSNNNDTAGKLNRILHFFSISGVGSSDITDEVSDPIHIHIKSEHQLPEIQFKLTNEKGQELTGVFDKPITYQFSIIKHDDI